MAVGKQIAIDKFNVEVARAVNIAIPAIDRYLNTHIDGDVTTVFVLKLRLPKINDKVFDDTISKICETYRNNGWAVGFETGEDRDHGVFTFY